jgi:DNA-cytosine methyltransferase
MNVLSLFDGISAGQLALQRAGIKVDNYFSSEIDKYAISITKENFSDTIQLGDIKEWKNWKLPEIDLVIAGFPCQSFSVSGKRKGLEDLRGQLIYPMLEIIKAYHPTYFILENVKGILFPRNASTFNFIIDSLKSCGYKVSWHVINSATVSAQNRERLYITNFNVSYYPEDKGIILKDIIENGEVDRDKSFCIDANYYKGGSIKTLLKNYESKSRRQIVKYVTNEQVGSLYENNSQAGIIYSIDGKSVTLKGSGGGMGGKTGLYLDRDSVRKLTPIECERLQTFPDNFTEFGMFYKTTLGEKIKISNTQRYKALGNSFTVDIITHILGFIGKE